MVIKYFNSNDNDEFKFSREELEKLINDVYEEGRKEANITSFIEIIDNPTVYNETNEEGKVYCTDTDSIGRITLEKIKGD